MAKLNFSVASVEPFGRAAGGDYSMLAARIREGSASQEERDLAADIIEGKIKRPANRPASYDIFERDLAIYEFVRDRIGYYCNQDRIARHRDDPKKVLKSDDLNTVLKKFLKKAVGDAVEKEKLSASTIYGIHARISDAMDRAKPFGPQPDFDDPIDRG